jgi:hypothetical protein
MEDPGSIFMSDPHTPEYQAGYAAMGVGTPLQENPYITSSVAWVRWSLGWYASANDCGMEGTELAGNPDL